jgi:hypothetical protein
LDKERVQKMVLETKAYLEYLESILQTGSFEAREAAVGQALQIQEFLDAQLSYLIPFPSLELLSDEEREILAEISEGLRLSTHSKTKIKQIKPIKLR